jgi:hypothetical protein
MSVANDSKDTIRVNVVLFGGSTIPPRKVTLDRVAYRPSDPVQFLVDAILTENGSAKDAVHVPTWREPEWSAEISRPKPDGKTLVSKFSSRAEVVKLRKRTGKAAKITDGSTVTFDIY